MPVERSVRLQVLLAKSRPRVVVSLTKYCFGIRSRQFELGGTAVPKILKIIK